MLLKTRIFQQKNGRSAFSFCHTKMFKLNKYISFIPDQHLTAKQKLINIVWRLEVTPLQNCFMEQNAIVLQNKLIVTKMCMYVCVCLWIHAGIHMWHGAGHQWDEYSCDTSQTWANESLFFSRQLHSWQSHNTLLGPTKGSAFPA